MDQLGTSTLITRMTSDINQIQSGVNLVLRLFLRSPFIVFGAMIMAFTVDVKAALVFVVTIPLLSLIVFGIMLVTMPMYKKVQADLDQVLLATRENLTGARVIRAFNKEEDETKRFENANQILTDAQKYVGRISGMMNPLTYIIVNGAIIALIYVGAVRVDIGDLTQGQVVALINYMSQILVELVKLANLIISVTKAAACLNRVESVLAVKPDMNEGDVRWKSNSSETDWDLKNKIPVVEFSHVSLTYKGTSDTSLSDINFCAKKGQTIGIIGGTGSGKSSLVNLIPRFYDATDGTVKINGRDIKEYQTENLREHIGVVLQKAVLFKGSIADNLRWGKEDATEQEMYEALDISQAREFVDTKQGGLEFQIEQGGRNLSGGQKQRMTIARALVRKPGMAFSNALLGIVHSMAHKTGAAFEGGHIIHGAANAMYLPKVIKYNSKDETAAKRYAYIADFLGLGGNTTEAKIDNLIAMLRKMNDELNIPQCIKNYGEGGLPAEQGIVPEDEFLAKLPEVAANAISDACTGSNPRQPSQEEMEKLLKCCYYDTEVDF